MKIQIEQLDLLAPWPQLVLRDGYQEMRILVRLGSIPIGQVATRPLRKRVVSHRRLRLRVARELTEPLLKTLAQEGLSAGPNALKWFMPAAWGHFDMSSADATERRAYVEERFLLTTGLASPLREWVIESQQRPPAWPLPAVTVALCTRDREPILEEAIHALQSLDYPNFDILVINNSSDPVPTREIADRLGVQCVRCKIPGLSRARNKAIENAHADWIAFIDDDCQPEMNWLKELVRATQNDKCRVVIGQTLPAHLENAAEIALDTYEHRTGHAAGANMLIDRSIAHRIGGFDTDLGPGPRSLGGGEDADFLHRIRHAGYAVEQAPRALVHHHRDISVRALRQQIRGRAMGLAAYHARHGQTLKLLGRLCALLGETRAAISGRSRYPFSLVLLEMKATIVGPVLYAWSRLSRTLRGQSKPQIATITPMAQPVASDPRAPIKPRLAA